jgi:hypothetical protein
MNKNSQHIEKELKNNKKVVLIIEDSKNKKKELEIEELQLEIETNLDIKLEENFGDRLHFIQVANEFKDYIKTVFCNPNDISSDIDICFIPAVLYFVDGRLYHYTHGGDKTLESHRNMYQEFQNDLLEKRV